MNRLRTFWDNIDAGMVRGGLVILAAVAVVSAIVVTASKLIGFDENGLLSQAFHAVSGSYWAIPVVIAIFTAGSFVGAPQFVMVALAVAAFGPFKGFLYSYVATLCSATVNFQLARLLGADWMRRRGFPAFDRISGIVGRNGFMTSLLVRVVPSAPFVVVNAGLGLTETSYLAFIAGTAAGIIPKTAIIALLGKVVERATSGDVTAIAYLAGAMLLWLSLAVVARYLIRRRAPAQ